MEKKDGNPKEKKKGRRNGAQPLWFEQPSLSERRGTNNKSAGAQEQEKEGETEEKIKYILFPFSPFAAKVTK